MDGAEAVYADTPAMVFYNRVACAALESLVAQSIGIDEYDTKVIEIGAGTGATTSSVLPMASAWSVEYWFTDLSDVFLSRAQQRWAKR